MSIIQDDIPDEPELHVLEEAMFASGHPHHREDCEACMDMYRRAYYRGVRVGQQESLKRMEVR